MATPVMRPLADFVRSPAGGATTHCYGARP